MAVSTNQLYAKAATYSSSSFDTALVSAALRAGEAQKAPAPPQLRYLLLVKMAPEERAPPIFEWFISPELHVLFYKNHVSTKHETDIREKLKALHLRKQVIYQTSKNGNNIQYMLCKSWPSLLNHGCLI